MNTMDTRSPPPTAAAGFTLIELVIVIVVLAAGLVGIFAVFNQTVARSADPMLQQQALAIGEGYMEEILGMAWRDCSPSSTPTGSRGEWSTVEDYDNIDDNPPRDVQGNTLDALADYRVQVSTDAASLAGVPACRITVRVTHINDSAVRAELIAYRAED